MSESPSQPQQSNRPTTRGGSTASAYNKDWQNLFDSFKGKNPTKAQILNKRSSLVTKYAAGYICGAV